MKFRPLLLVTAFLAGAACGPKPGAATNRPNVVPGTSGYVSPDMVTEGSTTIDSRDLTEAADGITRNLLSQPKVATRTDPPRLLIDTEGWINESSATLNMNMLADDIRTSVIEKGQGRLRVVNREAIAQVEKERALKRDGVVGNGSLTPTAATMGADYRLKLRITSHDGTNKRTGGVDRAFQLSFELIDLETAESVWAKQFKTRKAGADNEVYQ